MKKELRAAILYDNSIELEWINAESELSKDTVKLQEEIFRQYKSGLNNFLLFLAFCNNKIKLHESLDYFRTFASVFKEKLRLIPEIESLRDNFDIKISGEEIKYLLEIAPFITGYEHFNAELINNLWDLIISQYKLEIRNYNGSVSDFIMSYSPDIHLVGRVFFHLVESKIEDYPFAFMATYSTGLNQKGKSKHIPLKHALSEYHEDSRKLLELLSTVHLAAKESSIIPEFLESGEIFHPLKLTEKEALLFLQEIPVYEKYGILCRIPNWWKNKSNSVQLNIGIGTDDPKYLGMDAILDFNASFLLGDIELTEKEVQKLINETEGLAFIKGKWIEVDSEKLKKTLDVYQSAKDMMGNGLTLKDAMQMQLNPGDKLGYLDDDLIQISNGSWFKTVLEKLKDPQLIDNIKLSQDFKADLRPYQEKGLNWLYYLHNLKLGACLADDMGLGKTVQLLALLSITSKEKKKHASLLVLPASLISNWINEIDKFSPGIKYYIAHPSFDHKSGELVDKFIKKYDIIITTYSLVKRYEWLKSYMWKYIILDEAQAIKNPGTKQTKSIKKLDAENRIILTGTPIENRLSDLWSLFDFLNPGLLGNSKEFTNFTRGLKNNPCGYSRLKKIISPYILRRLKTDKSVISDLPDKIEMKTYSELSKKQIVLYKKLVEDLKQILETGTEGIQRKGAILGSLMKFKQLCNHPDQYLDGNIYLEKESGKFNRLREICETIYKKREKVLIFTQFREITNPLKEYLETIFEHGGLVLHGGTPVKKRKEIVNSFQSHEYIPFIVITVKAGGVGLNLTAANHVIHFDRWWNPAVENQATDRAFRIGQRKNVIVHKFITKGTIEEKIDNMLTEKALMANEIIQDSNEAWITEMNDEKILDMFKLRL